MVAAKKLKLYRAVITGTGINETILCLSHDIVGYSASTYHRFVYPNGVVILKNDFGISSVALYPVEMSPEELSQQG